MTALRGSVRQVASAGQNPDSAGAMNSSPYVYVDADACPVKAEVVKVAERHGAPVVFVANAFLALPRGPGVRLQVVSGSFDAADDWIAEHVGQDDVVITAAPSR